MQNCIIGQFGYDEMAAYAEDVDALNQEIEVVIGRIREIREGMEAD